MVAVKLACRTAADHIFNLCVNTRPPDARSGQCLHPHHSIVSDMEFLKEAFPEILWDDGLRITLKATLFHRQLDSDALEPLRLGRHGSRPFLLNIP